MPSKEIMSWSISEYPNHERGILWYVVMAMVGIALLVYAVRTSNILFAFIIIIFAIIQLMHSWAGHKTIVISIADDGLNVGAKKYLWRDIKSFWMVYEPPMVKKMYFEFGKGLRPRLMLPLEDQDPVQVRESLLAYALEDTEKVEEPISEWFGRVFKI